MYVKKTNIKYTHLTTILLDVFFFCSLHNPAARPQILTMPEIRQRVAEGRNFTISCEVTGNPIVTWYKADMQITGGRFKVLENGNLLVDVSKKCKHENPAKKGLLEHDGPI